MDRYALPVAIVLAALIIVIGLRKDYLMTSSGVIEVDRLTGSMVRCVPPQEPGRVKGC